MSNENALAKVLQKVSQKGLSLERILSLPFFRDEAARAKDIASAIWQYTENELQDYVNNVAKLDEEIGKQVKACFVEYASFLKDRYRSSLRTAEANDTYDKVTGIIELGLDATGVGAIPSQIHRWASILGPIAANVALWKDRSKNSRYAEQSASDAQKSYMTERVFVHAGCEAPELIPGIAQASSPATLALDAMDMYVLTVNGAVARSASVRVFNRFMEHRHPELYQAVSQLYENQGQNGSKQIIGD